jgi:hypothetical protein
VAAAVDVAEHVEVGVDDGERVLGDGERGVEDLEREGLGRQREVGTRRRRAHVTSPSAACTWSALTAFALASAAAAVDPVCTLRLFDPWRTGDGLRSAPRGVPAPLVGGSGPLSRERAG